MANQWVGKASSDIPALTEPKVPRSLNVETVARGLIAPLAFCVTCGPRPDSC